MKERKKTGIAFNTELIRTILPPRLICLFLQENNRFLIFSTNGSQVALLFGFAPIGRPRYLNGILSRRQLRKVDAEAINSEETFTPNNPLLKKFTLRPEAISNPLRIAFKAQRFEIDASPIHNVSSAYCKCEMTTSPLPKEKPLKIPKSTALRITPLKPSTTSKKRKGANGSPCLSPL
jgi:hypothetical protein